MTSQVYIVTTISVESGEVRAYVLAESHKEALIMYMDSYPGITDMNTVYVAEDNASRIITKKETFN
ncbi:MAG TPA: hypothetical protein VGE93_06370 [Bryobacteraceae bacterium]